MIQITDNEFIRALECCCKNNDCDGCPLEHLEYASQCASEIAVKSLDLINCLQRENGKNEKVVKAADKLIETQKAEIERLRAENKLLIDNDVSNKYPNCVLVEKGRIYTKTLEDYDELIGDISAEAVKEFAERLKENAYPDDSICTQMVVVVEDIDALLKEMVGEQRKEEIDGK